MNIKDKLIHLLEGTGYTQKKVATKTGLSTAVISQYLKGVYNGNISKAAQALGVARSTLYRRAARRGSRF